MCYYSKMDIGKCIYTIWRGRWLIFKYLFFARNPNKLKNLENCISVDLRLGQKDFRPKSLLRSIFIRFQFLLGPVLGVRVRFAEDDRDERRL